MKQDYLSIPNKRGFKVSMTRGASAKVRIIDLMRDESIVIPYNYAHNSALECAIAYLNTMQIMIDDVVHAIDHSVAISSDYQISIKCMKTKN